MPALRFAEHPKDPRKPLDEWVHETWYEAKVEDDWLVAYRLVPQGARLIIAEVRIFPNEPKAKRRRAGAWSAEELGTRAVVPSGGVTADLLLRVRVGQHRREAEAALEEWAEQTRRQAQGEYDIFAESGLFGRHGITPEMVPRTPRNDLFYAQLSFVYAKEIAAGNRRPIALIADRLKRSSGYVRNLLDEARARELLTPAPRPGQAGGELTAKARRVLAQASERTNDKGGSYGS